MVVDGRLREVAALEEREESSLDGVLDEAFNASGNFGRLCEVLAGRVRTLSYRTIRYLGYAAIMKALLNDLRLRDPSDELGRILEQAVPDTLQDVVVFVPASGTTGVCLLEETCVRKVCAQAMHGALRSAIQVTRASTITAVLGLLASGVLPQSGLVPQEQLALDDLLADRFGRVFAAEARGPGVATGGAARGRGTSAAACAARSAAAVRRSTRPCAVARGRSGRCRRRPPRR